MKNFKRLANNILKRRCPKCGNGKIFIKYLTLADSCTECGESFKELRADDGPAWMTMMLVGHIVTPLMVAYELNQDIPLWISILVWPSLFAITAIITLPFAKAFFVNMIWRGKQDNIQ